MYKKTIEDRFLNIFIYMTMIFAAVIVIIPLFSVVSMSLVSGRELAEKGIVIFPQDIDFQAYKNLFAEGSVLINGFIITLFRIVVGTAVNLLCSYVVAYALARRDLPGRSALTMFFFFTMLFGGGLIPTYIVVKSTGLINNIWVYILPGIISVWNMLLIRNFIMNIPVSLFESAEIDGAGNFRIIFQLVLPLSVPALVTIGMFYAVAHWNSWWDAYLYTSKPDLQPIQLVLRNILAMANIQISAATASLSADLKVPSRALQNAAVVVTTLPIVIIYPFLQKYFIKGIMVGAVKG